MPWKASSVMEDRHTAPAHALIAGHEQALSAEYYFLAGEHERVAALEPTDTAAHHSWYYTILEFVKKLKGKEKAAYLKQAAAVSAEQKRRRRNLERRILQSGGAR